MAIFMLLFNQILMTYPSASFSGHHGSSAKSFDGRDMLTGILIGNGNAHVFSTPDQKEHLNPTSSDREDHCLRTSSFKFQKQCHA
jgi:hypothetical protein